MTRYMVVTNVPWLWQLTRDSVRAARDPTFSWDWTQQDKAVPYQGDAFRRRFAELFEEFVQAPSEHQCRDGRPCSNAAECRADALHA